MPRGRGLKTLLAGKKPILVQWWEAPAWERVEIVIAFKINQGISRRPTLSCHLPVDTLAERWECSALQLMIVHLAVSSAQFIDHQAKERADEVRLENEEIARLRALKCASPLHQSPFKDCPDCGLDLQSEALQLVKSGSPAQKNLPPDP